MPTDAADASLWTQEEAKAFFEAFQKYNTDWEQVAQAVPRKGPGACEELYRSFKSFLSLPKPLLNVTAFLAVVKDSLKMEDSEAETVSDKHSEPEEGKEEGASKVARGRRLQSAVDASQSNKRQASPVWGSRRPRAQTNRASPDATEDFSYRSPSSRSRRSKGQTHAEMMDAEGIDALLSLAAVAQEASNEYDKGVVEEGRPVRSHKKPRRHDEEAELGYFEKSPRGRNRNADYIYSPPGRARTNAARQLRSPVKDPLPPRTPLSRSKREKAKAARASWRDEVDGRPEVAIKPEDEDREAVGLETRPRRRRQARVPDDDQYELKPAKRSRHSDTMESAAQQHRLEETNLEAENEILDDEEDDDEEFDWERPSMDPQPRRRTRKSIPERAPPMMASAKALFARRSSLAFASPPPAFLIGVPPPNAQLSGVETEGQTSMGPAELRLRHCLDPRMRRWCSYEFFYSAVDRPWLMRNELLDYLHHVGIPEGVKLTKPEMSIIRASLGRPRRLSLSYLRQERIKLEAWREKVREAYSELGPGAEVPADMPRQLQVGQRVTARHPVTRQLHDGDVLTVAADSYRVQFDRRELGVELVKDIDVMPVDPTDSLPASMLQYLSPQALFNGRQLCKGTSRAAPLADSASMWPDLPGQEADMAAKEASTPTNVPTAIHNLADMKAALDTKESLLAQLKRMNDEVDAGMHKEVNGQRPEAFQKAYAQVLVDLQMMNKLLDNSTVAKQLSTASPSSPVDALSPAQRPLPSPAAQPSEATAQQPTAASNAGVVWDEIWREGMKLVKEAKAGNEQGGKSQEPEETMVANLVTGCVSFLLALYQCTSDAQLSTSFESVVGHALKSMRPRSKKNEALYSKIQAELANLKG